MTSFPRDGLSLRSKLALHWRASDAGRLDPRDRSSGALTPLKPLTGQSVTFVRASEASATDTAGSSYTVGHSQPAWSWVAGEPGIYVRASATGRSVESVEVDFNRASLKNHTGYVALYTPDGFPTGSASRPILHWGNASGYDVSDWAYYYATGQSATGTDMIEVRWYCSSSGALDVGLAINGGAELAGTSAGANAGVNTAPASALWIGSRGTDETSGAAIKTVKIATGEMTMTQIRKAF